MNHLSDQKLSSIGTHSHSYIYTVVGCFLATMSELCSLDAHVYLTVTKNVCCLALFEFINCYLKDSFVHIWYIVNLFAFCWLDWILDSVTHVLFISRIPMISFVFYYYSDIQRDTSTFFFFTSTF